MTDLDALEIAVRSAAGSARSGEATPRHVGAGHSEPRVLLRRYQQLALSGDAGAAIIGAAAGEIVRPGHLALALPVVWIAVIAAQRGYERRFLSTGPEEYRRVLNAAAVTFAVIVVISFTLGRMLERGYLFTAVPVALLLTLLVRRELRRWIFGLRVRGLALYRALVTGRPDAVVSVIEKLDREPQHGLAAVGACVPYAGADFAHDVPLVGDPGRVLEAVEETGAHAVVIASQPDLSGQALRQLSRALEERDVDVIVAPGIVEVAGPRLSIRPIAGLSLLQLERPSTDPRSRPGKAVFDRVLGGLMLLLALPAMVVIAMAIRMTSAGPVLYREPRIGVGGRAFNLFGFRTTAAEGDLPRLTGVGGWLRRFSLDELPQLINVVAGQMSLVGPRPPAPAEVASAATDVADRLTLRPGLTGLWRIGGPGEQSWEESLRVELRQADNWSPAQDVVTLGRTLRRVIAQLVTGAGRGHPRAGPSDG